MKKLLLIVLPLLIIVGCSKPINEETLIDKDGLKYHPETKELYSGKVFKNRMGGKKEFEGSYKDGDSTGIWTHWYENGQKKKEGTWKDGKGDGLITIWYENGQKNYEVTFKDGKKDGLRTSWYENGQKKYEGTYKDGRKDGLYNSWYENGQKKSEGISKDGKYDGFVTFWYENGQKKFEGTYKDGKLDGLETEWHENGQKKTEVTFKNGRLDLSTLSVERLMEISQFELDQNNAEYAIYVLDELINNHPEDRLASSVQYKIAIIYKNWKSDPSNFIKSLEKTVNNYPNSLHAKMAKKEIASFQEWIINNAETLRKRKMTMESINNLDYLVKNFPKHELASKAQYMVGDIYMNDLKDFEKALTEYKVVLSNYDGSKEEPLAEFMIGYIYANVLKDFKQASKTYQNFLKRFPNHELAPSIKFELDFIGKNINEIPAIKKIKS